MFFLDWSRFQPKKKWKTFATVFCIWALLGHTSINRKKILDSFLTSPVERYIVFSALFFFLTKINSCRIHVVLCTSISRYEIFPCTFLLVISSNVSDANYNLSLHQFVWWKVKFYFFRFDFSITDENMET